MRSFLCLALMILMHHSFAGNNSAGKLIQRVYSKLGNIYYQSDDHVVQITHSGTDSSPILSSDRTMITFVRIGNKIIPSGCDDFADTKTKYGNQVWIYNIAKKEEHLIVAIILNAINPKNK